MIFSNKIGALQFAGLVRFSALALNSVILAKAGYNNESISAVETFLFLLNLVTFFWINSFTTMLFRENKDSGFAFQIFKASLVLGLFSGLLLLTGLLSLPAWKEVKAEHAFILIGTVFFQGPSLLLEPFLFKQNRLKELVLASGLSAVFLTGVFAMLALNKAETRILEFVFLGFALLRTAALLLYMNKDGLSLGDISLPWKLIAGAMPLFLSSGLAGFAEQINGLLVKTGLGNDEFVLLRYGSREFPLVMILANAFSNTMVHTLSDDLSPGLQELKNKSRKLMLLCFPVSIVLMLSSSFVFHWLFNPQIESAYLLFNVVLLLTIPRMLFPQAIILSKKGDRWILYSVVLEILVDLAVYLMLVPYWGVMAAPAAMVSGYTADKLFLMWVCYREYRLGPKDYLPIAEWTIGSVLLLACWIALL